ncbi:hypothetical protein NXW13_16075 [Bacteroides thetaiotaomicron]|uniref:hypothetical protein n=1 Tax=Bacteroides cellulosilyticus TaxID=246787 RepID=UPI0034A12361|nr:hypothetical protein [Bacteroides thetaiotaomicron]
MRACERRSPLSLSDNGKSAVYGMTVRECNTPAYLAMERHSPLSKTRIRSRMGVHKYLSGFVGGIKGYGSL